MMDKDVNSQTKAGGSCICIICRVCIAAVVDLVVIMILYSAVMEFYFSR